MMNQQPTPADNSGKQVKLSLASLPADIKEGDKLSLTVTGMDRATGTAYCTTQAADAMPAAQPDDSAPTDDQSEGDAPLDTKTLLGPMDGLKNYLVQKSMDVPKNQGR